MSVCKQDKLDYILHLFVLRSVLFTSRTRAEKILVTKAGSNHLILLAKYTNSMMDFPEMDFQKKFYTTGSPYLMVHQGTSCAYHQTGKQTQAGGSDWGVSLAEQLLPL